MIVVGPLLTISGAFRNRLLLLSAQRARGLQAHCWMPRCPGVFTGRAARLWAASSEPAASAHRADTTRRKRARTSAGVRASGVPAHRPTPVISVTTSRSSRPASCRLPPRDVRRGAPRPRAAVAPRPRPGAAMRRQRGRPGSKPSTAERERLARGRWDGWRLA